MSDQATRTTTAPGDKSSRPMSSKRATILRSISWIRNALKRDGTGMARLPGPGPHVSRPRALVPCAPREPGDEPGRIEGDVGIEQRVPTGRILIEAMGIEGGRQPLVQHRAQVLLERGRARMRDRRSEE